MKLVVVYGEPHRREWLLSETEPVTLGRRAPGWKPAVDLSPDRYVSRRHALLWAEGGRWWMLDQNSRNGTAVADRPIAREGPVPVEPGIPVRVGHTTLVLVPRNWYRVPVGELVLEFSVAPAVSYALVHCGAPLMVGLLVRNPSAEQSRPLEVGFTVPGCAVSDRLAVPALAPGEILQLPAPDFRWALPALEAQVERGRASLQAMAAGEPVRHEPNEFSLLAFNEWSCAPEHRATLAAFALPNHPLVVRLAHAARQDPGLPGVQTASDALESIYRLLAEHWDLAYAQEAPSFEGTGQKIRLPHEVFLDPGQRRGQATCLDLALVVAGCLEHLGWQPALALVEVGACWHALVGCYASGGYGEPLLGEAALLPEAQVDPTGCMGPAGARIPYALAAYKAGEYLQASRLMFGLDLAACRVHGITPLPFAGEPPWSEEVVAAVAAARDHAARWGEGRPGLVHLMMALLSRPDGLAARVFSSLGVSAPEAVATWQLHLGPVTAAAGKDAGGRDAATAALTPSRHHDQALAAARALAKRHGSPLVEAEHVLASVLEVQSVALTAALGTVGLDRRRVLAAVGMLAPGPEPKAPWWPSHSRFGGGGSS